MIKKTQFIIAILQLLPWLLFSQPKGHKNNFDNVVFIVKGDLNKDNLADSVVVTQDTLNNTYPYKLEIYFAKPDSKYVIGVESDSAIEADFPLGKDGFRNGTGFLDITIASGVLSINCELTRGHFEHKFRYQNGNFELVAFTQVYAGGTKVYTIDFNLSTGWLIKTTEATDSDKLFSRRRQKLKIRPLPKLQNFKPFATNLF
jgi:hypothetical protein